jgi:hypothetical protein
MEYRKEGGYVGLIMLVVSVAIIALAFTKVYLTPHAQPAELRAVQPQSASGTMPTTEIEQMHADVDAANSARELLNKHNQDTSAAYRE